MRKVFTVGQVLNVNNGNETLEVTVNYVRGNTIRVIGTKRSAPDKICATGHPSIIGDLKYYKRTGTYQVSRGGTNGKYPAPYVLVDQ